MLALSMRIALLWEVDETTLVNGQTVLLSQVLHSN
jgi:hypothetical protein